MEEILTVHFDGVRVSSMLQNRLREDFLHDATKRRAMEETFMVAWVSSMARPNKQFCRAMEEILMQQKQLHEGFLHGATDLGP